MKMAYKLDSVFKVLLFLKPLFPKLFKLEDHVDVVVDCVEVVVECEEVVVECVEVVVECVEVVVEKKLAAHKIY
jgi:hypothetical protein